MKCLIALYLLIGSISSFAFAEEKNSCFKAIDKHITEAIEHNKKASKQYALLSDGESKNLSSTLIAFERLSKLLVKKIETESRIYQEKGVPVLCDELADMKDVPEFKELLPKELRPVQFYKHDYKTLSKKLKDLIKEDRLEEAYQLIAIDLNQLEAEPQQQCLGRHFLESIARTLKLAPKHRAEAEALGLPDPLDLIKKFVTLQRRGLSLTNYLDTQAFPLQKDGLLIFCQDVPSIDWK